MTSFGPKPWLQAHWDARAAVNFMAGGCGSGLIVFAALAGAPAWAYLAGAALVALGLTAVALEIGRPLRALNVYRHPQRSWMSREAIVAPLLLAAALAAWIGVPGAGAAAAVLALAFVYCQGRMLRAAKGIPAWREPTVVPLLVATALAEGGGAFLLLAGASGGGTWPVWALFGMALAARWALWGGWRRRLKTTPRALQQIDRAGRLLRAGTLLALALALAALLMPPAPLLGTALPPLAGALALAAGWWFKFTLITRAAFNQGFAIAQLPVRGVRRHAG
jgi:phenylacetyl-CoA:acceptor oxidoreductase subunit 2